MTFQINDKIISVYTQETGEIISLMSTRCSEKNLFYIELLCANGKKEHHIYAEDEILHA